MVAVDMRTCREDMGPGRMNRRDHPAQFDEFLVPLPGVAEGGDAMTELLQGELRIVLDMEVEVDQAGHDGAAGEIDALGARRRRHRFGRSDESHAIALNHQPATLDRRAARAIDDADVVEDERSRLQTARMQSERTTRESDKKDDWSKHLAHRHRL